MPQFQRSTWFTYLFVGMFAPFVAALFWLVAFKQPARAASEPATRSTSTAGPLTGPGMVAPPGRASYPMFAAGDESTLWVAHPLLFEGKDPAFELMARTNTGHAWKLLRDSRGASTTWGYPKNLAAVSWPQPTKARAVPVVFSDHGDVRFFSSSGEKIADNLPRDHTLLAAAGSSAGVFAITLGPPSPSTTRTGDLLNTRPEIPTSGPAATTTSRPATTTSKPAPAAPWVNAYWMKDSRWFMLPALGPASESKVEPDNAAPGVPSASAMVALACVEQRLVLLWVEPSRLDVLNARQLEYKVDGAKWTRPVVTHLTEPLPAKTRLLTVTVDHVLHLFWPTLSSTPGTIELHGGRIVTVPRKGAIELTMPKENFLPPLLLKGAGDGLNPATDIVIGPAENSIAAVVNSKDNTLLSYLFNDRGSLMSGPDTVEPQQPRGDVQFARNIAMLILILMLTLSFWQWRQRPGALKLPEGMTVARPTMRVIAFLIDLAIPYVIVCIAFGLWEDEGYIKILTALVRSVTLNFDVLFASPPLLTMLGIYLGHVMIGELFFRRSIGKALTGLQVRMVDGTSPTLAATLVRNLIRLPELLLGILVIYMMISPYRQRLGDLLGRTLVIAHKPPEAPADSDEAE